MTGERFGADEALQMGVVGKIFEDRKLMEGKNTNFLIF